MNRRIVFIGGIQGTGKTTIIKLAMTGLESKIAHLEVGTEMRAYANSMFSKTIEELTPAERTDTEQYIVRKIKSVNSPLILLDNHYAMKSPTHPDEYLDLTHNLPKIAHFVIIEPPTIGELASRIRSDPSGKRRVLGTTDMRRTIVAQRIVAREIARERKIPLTIIRNESNKEQLASERLRKILQGLVD